MKTRYTIQWSILVHKYNQNNVGQINQKRIASLFNVSDIMIYHCQTRPMKMQTITDKYKPVYDQYFKDTIGIEDILITHTSKNKV